MKKETNKGVFLLDFFILLFSGILCGFLLTLWVTLTYAVLISIFFYILVIGDLSDIDSICRRLYKVVAIISIIASFVFAFFGTMALGFAWNSSWMGVLAFWLPFIIIWCILLINKVKTWSISQFIYLILLLMTIKLIFTYGINI